MTPDDIAREVLRMGRQARAAAHALTKLSTEEKNAILLAMADALVAREPESSRRQRPRPRRRGRSRTQPRDAGPSPPRLRRIAAMAQGIREVAALHDPTGEILREWTRPNGLRLQKKRTPIGVIGIIYESRPNVTADAAVLCFKTGNATILRGGKEAIHSNRAIAAALQEGGARPDCPITASS